MAAPLASKTGVWGYVEYVPYVCPLCGRTVGADVPAGRYPEGAMPLCPAHDKSVALLAVQRRRKRRRLAPKRWRVHCTACRRPLERERVYDDGLRPADRLCGDCGGGGENNDDDD